MSRVVLNKVTIRGGQYELNYIESMFKTQEGGMEFALSKIEPVPVEFSDPILVDDLEKVEAFRKSSAKRGVRKLEASLKSGKKYKELVELADDIERKTYARCLSVWKTGSWGCQSEVKQLYMGCNDDKSELVIVFESIDIPPVECIRHIKLNCFWECEIMHEFISDNLNENGWMWLDACKESCSGSWNYQEGLSFRNAVKETYNI